jgi:hypothetical protein
MQKSPLPLFTKEGVLKNHFTNDAMRKQASQKNTACCGVLLYASF